MTNALCIKCLECNYEIMTKTAIGRGYYEEFAFPCPNCNVELRFGLELDQKNISFRYVNFKNCESISNLNTTYIIKLDAAHVIPNDIHPMISPFILSAKLAGDDYGEFIKIQQLRSDLPRNSFPFIEKLHIHYKNKNYSLYNKNLDSLKIHNIPTNEKAILDSFIKECERYSSHFIPQKKNKRNLIYINLHKFHNDHKVLSDEVLNYFSNDNRIEHYFNELWQIRLKWSAKISEILLPVYIFLKNNNLNLNEYKLCQKRFEDIKPFFIDVFETFCRISIIAASIEGCKSHGCFCVPKRKGSMDVNVFETMPNGSKPDIIKNLPIKDLFVNFIDSKLRNGVGHHSAQYEVVEDSILYRNQNQQKINDYNISYTAFCHKVLNLYIQLEIVSAYVHWLYGSKYGLKIKRRQNL